MCSKKQNGIVTTKTPNKQVKEYYKLLGITIPAQVNLKPLAKAMGLNMQSWLWDYLRRKHVDNKLNYDYNNPELVMGVMACLSDVILS